MTYEKTRITAWNEVASKAALDNINRVITHQDQLDQGSQSTRRQRVVRGSKTTDSRATFHASASGGNSRVSSTPTFTSPNLNLKDTRPPASDHHNLGLKQSPAPVARTPSVTASQASLETTYFDSRSFAASSVKPPIVSMAKRPLSSTDGNSNILPPHSRKPPSVSSSQNLSKAELFSRTNNHPSDLPSVSNASHASLTKSTYGRLLAAQAGNHVSESSQHDHDTKPAKLTSRPMNSGTAAKSAKIDARFPCAYEDCGLGFDEITALKKHKYLDHDGYCKLCDVDTKDHETLKQHKMDSLKHVVCQWCGKDFRSESGRDYHERQASELDALAQSFAD